MAILCSNSSVSSKLRQKLDRLLTGQSIILYPSHGCVAPRHKNSLWIPIRWAYTAIINVLELPATQIPLGINQDGLPLGVQLIGGHGRDELTISVAMKIEKQWGGWIPPTFPTSSK